MSTFATAKFDASDSEGDEDFVPSEASASRKKSKQGPKRKTSAGINASARPSKRSKLAGAIADGDDAEEGSATDSGSSDDEEGEDEGYGGSTAEMSAEAVKLKVEAEEAAAEERRRKARETFLSFQQASDSQSEGQDTSANPTSTARMVQVRRARVFAGETIHEIVSLPETDPEAIAFLAKQKEEAVPVSQPPPTSSPPASEPGAPASTTMMAMPEPAEKTAESAQAKAPEISTPPAPTASTAPAPKPAVKGGPPRRKPRPSLEAMASALGKGKKMTTLEKSQHDWKAHLAGSQAETDELEANRRSGGFLEKRDFLDRVGDRRSQAFEQNGKR